MSTIKKTGEWIYTTCNPGLEYPVGRMEVYFAKPCGYYMENARTVAFSDELRHRGGAVNMHYEEYQKLVYKILSGKDVTPKSIVETIAWEIERYNYTLEDFVSMVTIVTPYGECKLYSEEFNVVSLDWALNLANEEALMIRYLNNDGSVRDKLKNTSVSDKLFYLQTRGISFTQGMKIISGEIKSQHLFYFDPMPFYVECFQRHYLRIAKKKIEFCEKHNITELLEYKDTENGHFTLQEYVAHLEEQYESVN